ncbi:MAG TPA: carbon-nitrogen hydrolase family protein [Xanthobacteraceae bacterium]|nr:carbon-nitrogen hydrolase family protein [Xanthobacteraceae bacterium]
MGDTFPKFKAAAVHAASEFLDRDAGIEKVCRIIAEAASNGAKLVVFPESFVPGYPFWIWTHTPVRGAPLFYEFFTNSITVGSEQTDRIGAAARQAGVHVVLGISERDGGTLYNTLLYFDDTGAIIGRHRKLQPTHVERTVWGRGDASGLRVHQTSLGRIGGLICWEHTMDLARYALTSQREEIHIAAWPGISALTHDPNSGFFDEVTSAAARHHALSAQAFVINVQSRVDERVIEKLGLVGQLDMIRTGGGWSAIIAPNGKILAGPNRDEEAILYADIDLSEIVFLKYIVDSAGHYSRPDVLRIWANYEQQSITANGLPQAEAKIIGAESPAADQLAHEQRILLGQDTGLHLAAPK